MDVNEIIPELLVENMEKSLKFYTEVLEFEKEIIFPEQNPIFVQVKKDQARIMLYLRGDFENEIPQLKGVKMGGSTLLYLKVNGLDDFYKRIKNKVNIVQDLHKTDYGKLEFCFTDINGYLITFAE